MKCPECQAENREGRKFCQQCGAKLVVVCAECGYENLPGERFCGECGRNLTLPSEPAPKDLSFDEKLDKIQRYLPKGLTEKILAQKDRIEGERKQVTVMFCDMEGFTPLTERLGPDEAYGIMDQVYEILIHRVHHYEGTVNEMTGDGIMALFGAPIALEDAPQRAIRSALSIHREISKFSDRIKKEEEAIPAIKMRIGIHTGPVVVGSVGNDLRVEFKAVGDTVNMASRMEGLAEPGTTYVTEDVFSLTEGLFRFEALGEKQVKGKEVPVKVYHVLAPSTRRTRFDVSAERGLTPFVGRERDLDLLHDALERCKTGRGQAVSIMGDAGVGKSRFLYELRKVVSNEDITFLEGKSLSYSRNVAYHPLIDILKSNFDIHDEDGDSEIRKKVEKGLKILGADEASTLPYLLELLSVKDSGIEEISLSPEAKRNQIIEALKRITLKGSEIRPLILAFEDLHWIDKSSEECLKHMMDSISMARVLMIFTYRPDFVHTWGHRSYHSQVNLNRLSNRDSLAMVTYLLGTENIDTQLEEFLLQKTEGIPLFIEEFVKSLRNLKIIERTDGRYFITKDIKDVAVPSTVQDVIMARVDSLPEGMKSLLQTGSAIGREFSCDLIKRMTGLSEFELHSYLSGLRDAELLYERGIYPQSTFIFKHALTQEVAYNSLLQKRRKEIHESVGRAIEELYPERLEEYYELLAYHYRRSDNSDKAYHYLKLSGTKSTRTHSHWEAFRFYRAAIDVLNRLAATEENKKEQIEIRVLLSIPMLLLGYPEDSVELLHEGEKYAKEIGDERSLVILHSKLANYYSIHGEPLLAIKYTEGPFQQAKKSQDIGLMAQIACELCSSYLHAPEFQKIADLAYEVLMLLEKSHRERDFFGTRYNVYSALCAYRVLAFGWLGNFDEGKVFFEKGLRFATEINAQYSLGWTEFCYGHFFLTKGASKGAVEHFQKSIGHWEKAQALFITGAAWGGLGYGYYLLGELETAKRYIEKGLRIHTDAGPTFWMSLLFWLLGVVHLDLGDLKSAHNHMTEAVRLAHENNERHWEACSRVWLGRIFGKMGSSKSEKAEQYIVEGTRILDELRIKPFSASWESFVPMKVRPKKPWKI
jgi:class 3 adenylate cyclase/tetratricopeptide (TPR) repeat protein